ncbi:MAG: aminotransferase class IV [Deltaproteobacteria bacterium]|nr:aminotransferase class IV [Deltaproteobacteria bacterium]
MSEGGEVCINGRFFPADKAKISVFDRGLNYGDGLFETMKACQGRVIFFKEHMERLKKGAKLIGIPMNNPGDLKIKVARLLKLNRLDTCEARVKIILTRGKDTGGHLPATGLKPTVIITAQRLDTRAIKRLRKNGVKAILLKGRPSRTAGWPSRTAGWPSGTAGWPSGTECRRPAFLPFVKQGIKSLNYLLNVLGRMEASEKGAYEGIFTMGDSVIEGTSSNVFIVKGDVIKTPPPSLVLPGITRNAVIHLARRRGITVKETPLSVGDLKKSDEAFITNSIIGIAPLLRIDSHTIGSGRAGRITGFLRDSLDKLADAGK